jgi:hypothetical protein
MADAEKYANWIVANKDKKGTPEFETVANAYKQAKSETAQPQAPKPPLDTNLTFSEKAATAIGNMLPEFTDGWGSKGGKLAGLVQGAADPSVGIAQLGANIVGQGDSVNPAIQAQNAGYEQAREQEGRDGFDWSRLAGNIASPVNVLGARFLPKAPTSGGQAFKQGAGIGAIYGAQNPVNNIAEDSSFFDEKAQQVAKGAATGGVLSPALTGIANQLKNQGAAKYLMQSALKPTIDQRKSGEADRAIATLLKEKLNATKGGVEELQNRVGNINDEIKTIIASSDKKVDKQAVINRLKETVDKFATQVSPKGDLKAIKNITKNFKKHPSIQGAVIPVQQAQALKQGTYRVLNGKFGETGSAATEAQKALARGLKEEIARMHPAVGKLNARESDLINALNVTERRALLDANKNPIGLAGLAGNPIAMAGMLADRSALVKSLVARGANRVTTLNNHPELAQKLAEMLRKTAPYAGIPIAAPFVQSGN